MTKRNPDGCPTFAPAYVGRKRRAKRIQSFLLVEGKRSKNSIFGPCSLVRTWGTHPGPA
jgi:hypothetical protein